MDKQEQKEAMKQLRAARKVYIERARKAIKTQNGHIRKIKAQIETEAKTVPRIANAIGMETALVLQYVATLREYGQVAEDEADGDYFTYRWV